MSDESITIGETEASQLRALLRETHAPTLSAALEQARQAVASWGALPSSMALAGILGERDQARDQLRLVERALGGLAADYRESEERRRRAERILERIRMLAGGSVVEIAAREVDSQPIAGRGM